jgi:predicted transcriptional regulator
METKADQIYQWIIKNGAHTELEIARGVGLKKTPYTRWILFSLMEHGYIARTWDESRQPKAYVYYAQLTQELEMK